MKKELADIAVNERQKLQGFKVLGVFPFHLTYITTGTHIRLCRIKAQIAELRTGEPKASDFYDAELQEKLVPLINKYCVTALLNNRNFSWLFRFFLNRKIAKCSNQQILNLYLTIQKLNEPAFFLAYWNLVTQKDDTLLRVEKQS